MNLLSEFKALTAQSKRKQIKTPEDEAIIAAGAAIEFWLSEYPDERKAQMFELVGLSI